MTLHTSRDHKRLFWLIAALALSVHLVFGLAQGEFVINADGTEYLNMATNLLAGRGYSYDGENPVVGKPPGFPAFLAVYSLITPSLNGIQIAQLLLLFASYVAVAWIGFTRLGIVPAIICLAVLTAAEPLRRLTHNLYSEPLFFALFTSALILLLRSLTTRSLAGAAAAGVVFGMATYVRPITLFWPFVLIPLAILFDRRSVKASLVVAAAHTMIVMPWIVRTSMWTGRATPMVANWGPAYAMTDDSLWREYMVKGWTGIHTRPEFTPLLQGEFTFNPLPQERLRGATIAGWKHDTPGTLSRCFRQTLNSWTYVPGTKMLAWQAPGLFWAGRVLVLAFYGFVIAGSILAWKRQRWLILISVGYGAYNALILFPVTTESRYLLAVYMCLLPLAAWGAWHLISNRTLRLKSVEP